jgi:hypothetical protein
MKAIRGTKARSAIDGLKSQVKNYQTEPVKRNYLMHSAKLIIGWTTTTRVLSPD